ncbi:hypothetical protein [Clostridium perfringens]|uniref:hypothetical protein n=1 Tax=Clostridium perfringens TaxID=1502 RepID=UPI0008A6F2C1|nr:hypothetical protein [Clostridium perfringens]AOY53707.1 hypothetical protein FORC25_1291 [Clostridium perfringens]EJT5934060.1 hypothetical protein [Clostridium perfringens]ELC8347549.1 hypothetical protein [Clostridium perfringens]MDK0678424.1 hypothetical protein [Clostridium perfringens]TBX12757.1 hypothetical protein BFS03_05815 [Clostridium perfringens]
MNAKEEYIFTTKDPLDRIVVLKKSTLEDHISGRHDEKSTNDIKANIKNPKYIIKDTKEHLNGNERNIYLDLTTSKDNDGNLKFRTMKTVVEFKEEITEDGTCIFGEVVTNYIMRKCSDSSNEGGLLYERSTDSI